MTRTALGRSAWRMVGLVVAVSATSPTGAEDQTVLAGPRENSRKPVSSSEPGVLAGFRLHRDQ